MLYKLMEKLLIVVVVDKLVKDGFAGSSFLNFIIIKNERILNNGRTLQHEKIHYYQQVEMLFIFMWIAYILNLIINVFKILLKKDQTFISENTKGKKYGLIQKAYRNISFEIEAYNNEKDANY